VKPAIHAVSPQELAESAGGLSDLQICVQMKFSTEFACLRWMHVSFCGADSDSEKVNRGNWRKWFRIGEVWV
jgi:hypothetical protein